MKRNLVNIHGDHNQVIQNPIINITYANNQIPFLASNGSYEAIQEIYKQQMTDIQNSHPLKQYFTVTPQLGNCTKLISTPKTEEALRKYPKTIKTTLLINKQDFPGMGVDENPWDYAYRTQKSISMSATDYKEYLGDIEDPFPTWTYHDGAKITITPPSFPEGESVTFIAGQSSFQTVIKRLPSENYKEIILFAKPFKAALHIEIIINIELNSFKITLQSQKTDSLDEMYLREDFLRQVSLTKKIDIYKEEKLFISAPLSENSLKDSLFNTDQRLLKFLKNLCEIQKLTNCSFSYKGESVALDNYYLSFVILASIKEVAQLFYLDFYKFHVERSMITKDFLEENIQKDKMIVMEIENRSFEFFGVKFSCNKEIQYYQNAKINNLYSVKKNVTKRKDKILITLKPQKENRILNYRQFEKISVIK